jgi:hypothetical protein
MAVYTSFNPKLGLKGSQTTPQYRTTLAAAFARVKAKQGAPTAGPAESGGAGSSSSGLPVDPVYDQQIGGLQRRRDDALAAYAAQRTTGLSDYGYQASYDAQGNATGLAYDPNNVYSQASLARKSYQNAKRGTGNSMAAQGQLYSGALTNAQNTNDTTFSVGEDARQKSLLRFLAGIKTGETNAGTDYELGAGTAAGDRLSRASSSPLYDPSTGADTTTPAAPAAPSATQKIQSNLGSWVVTTFTKNGIKYHKLADGRTVKA